jgi:hypothetical protein
LRNLSRDKKEPAIMPLSTSALAVSLTVFGLAAFPGSACHDGSPLILDLNGDGVRTVDRNAPVPFDLDGDGDIELVTWTFWETEEGFLALDLDGNRRIDSGRELFGDATELPSGELAKHGFAALAVHDQPQWGGDGDGMISAGDEIWRDLLIWVDENHDGVSQRAELRPLARHGVLALDLEFQTSDFIDGTGNHHRLRGRYLQRDPGGDSPTLRALTDVYFRVVSHDPP